MKKNVIILGCIILFAVPFCRAQAYEPGQLSFSAGYGFPNFARTALKVADGVSDLETSLAGPFYGKFEYAVTDVIGFGANVAYTHGSAVYQTSDDNLDSILYDTRLNYDSYSVVGRINFHFGHADMVDPYAGIGLGYRNSKYSYVSDDPNLEKADINGFNHFGLDFTLGARFYLTDNFGIYGEVGVAKTPLQIGLVAKF